MMLSARHLPLHLPSSRCSQQACLIGAVFSKPNEAMSSHVFAFCVYDCIGGCCYYVERHGLIAFVIVVLERGGGGAVEVDESNAR